MQNHITSKYFSTREEFNSLYRLCKSRGTGRQLDRGNWIAFKALEAAEACNEELFKCLWQKLKEFSNKHNPHTDRMFYDTQGRTTRSWTDLILCNLAPEHAGLAYLWIEQMMSLGDEGSLHHATRTWNRSFRDNIAWRRECATEMFNYRAARALLFRHTDISIEYFFIFDAIFNLKKRAKAALANLESQYIERALNESAATSGEVAPSSNGTNRKSPKAL